MKLHGHNHYGEWVCEDQGSPRGTDPETLIEQYRPGLMFPMSEFNQLNEYTYRDLAQLIDGNFLAQKVRAAALKGVEFHGVDNSGTVQFEVPSSEFEVNQIKYRNLVQFIEWDQIGQDNSFKNAVEKARILLWQGNIKLFCACPAFLYWGSAWILTVLDSAIYPEEREPKVRNPQHRGICCKHLSRVMQVLPFYSGKIAAEIKRQFG